MIKRHIKLISVVAALAVCVCSFVSCGKKDAVMTLDGGYALESDVFEWLVSYCKTEEYSTFMSFLSQSGEDTSKYDLTAYDFWRQSYGEDERTLAQIVIEEAIVVGKSYLSAEKQFDDVGLTMTKDDYAAIDSAVSEVETMMEERGTTLKEYLAAYGITKDTYRRVLVYQYKTNKLLTRLMSPGSRYEVTDKMVTDAFDSTVEAYGYSNVNHIFFYSVGFDSSGKAVALSDDDYNAIKDKAQKVYDSIMSGETQFEDFLEYSEDKYSPDGYLISIESSMTESFVENAVKMKVGEIRLFESEGIGFHIMKKYELTEENRTEIEDEIREKLEAEAEERIVNVYYDDIVVDDEKIAAFDAATAQLLV